MVRSISMVLGAAALLAGPAMLAQAQSPAAPGTAGAKGKTGANVGSLSCKVAGGMGFVFGSSKELDCLFTRTDGVGERYTGLSLIHI